MEDHVSDTAAKLVPVHGIHASLKAVAKSPHRWRRILLRLFLIGLAVALVAIFGKWLGTQLPLFEDLIKRLGWWGPVVFLAIFIILTLLQVPESLLAIAGGVAFGLWYGFGWVILANICGAAVGFWCYRILLRHKLESILQKHPKMEMVVRAVASKGFKLMVLLRLGPFNYSMLNAVLGASEVRFLPYMLALIGAFPGNFATVYFGTIATHIARKRVGTDNLDTTHEIVLITGFVLTILVFLFIAHVARHALKQAQADLEAGGIADTVK